MAVTVRVVALPKGIEDMTKQSDVGHLALRPEAEKILVRARPKVPVWTDKNGSPIAGQWRWWVRGGKGPQGAFAQAIVTGSGTQLAEFGGARSRAYAMLRSSL